MDIWTFIDERDAAELAEVAEARDINSDKAALQALHDFLDEAENGLDPLVLKVDPTAAFLVTANTDRPTELRLQQFTTAGFSPEDVLASAITHMLVAVSESGDKTGNTPAATTDERARDSFLEYLRNVDEQS